VPVASSCGQVACVGAIQEPRPPGWECWGRGHGERSPGRQRHSTAGAGSEAWGRWLTGTAEGRLRDPRGGQCQGEEGPLAEGAALPRRPHASVSARR